MTVPLPDDRRERLIAELRVNGMLRATDLADRLGVTPVTIRRDIRQLADEGVVRRVHGGAALIASERQPERHPAAVESTIGIVVPTLDYYWPGVIQGAKQEAAERGARLILRSTSYESTADRAQITGLLNSGADAIAFAPTVEAPATSAMLDWLHAAGVPVVLLEREARIPVSLEQVESVSTDHAAGARIAVQHLADLGHRRVALMVSSRSPHRRDIRSGWEAAVAGLGLGQGLGFELRFASLDAYPEDRSVVVDAFERALEGGATAVLVHADREAMVLAEIAQNRGLRIPEDLSIVAYDDEVAELFTPALTAVRPPRASIGRAAVGLLLDRIKDSERPAHRVVVSPKLSVRASTGPALTAGSVPAGGVFESVNPVE